MSSPWPPCSPSAPGPRLPVSGRCAGNGRGGAGARTHCRTGLGVSGLGQHVRERRVDAAALDLLGNGGLGSREMQVPHVLRAPPLCRVHHLEGERGNEGHTRRGREREREREKEREKERKREREREKGATEHSARRERARQATWFPSSTSSRGRPTPHHSTPLIRFPRASSAVSGPPQAAPGSRAQNAPSSICLAPASARAPGRRAAVGARADSLSLFPSFDKKGRGGTPPY
jgi:hypothetical protein